MESLEESLTYTVHEFCRSTSISRKTFYELQKRGIGPRLIRIGRRVYVGRETAQAWIRERELASAV